MKNGGSRATTRGPVGEHGVTLNHEVTPMTSLLRSALLCALLFSTASVAAEDAGPVQQEFIKRIRYPAVQRSPPARKVQWSEVRVGGSRDRVPSWMLSRMPVLVPNGTPQLVYRAPSAARGSPDFCGLHGQRRDCF
jgi:hypothetical protein